MPSFYLKKNDLLPRLRATLRGGNNAALNLTGAAVTFRMRAEEGTEPKVDAACTVVDAQSGVVEYAWTEGDTDTAGTYQAEFAVEYPTGVQTVPSQGFFTVEVGDSLA